MSDSFSKLSERIISHYNNKNYLSKHMRITQNDNVNFESINYSVTIQTYDLPTSDSEIDDSAEKIAEGLVNQEFSDFVTSLGKFDCKSLDTTLDNLVTNLDNSFNELWDNGYESMQLYMPYLLRQEIRERKNSNFQGIDFVVKTLDPFIVRELGNNQIIFSNIRCCGKTYPKTKKQILISQHRGTQYPTIYCNIVQKLDFMNQHLMRKIVVTNIDESQFLQK